MVGLYFWFLCNIDEITYWRA